MSGQLVCVDGYFRVVLDLSPHSYVSGEVIICSYRRARLPPWISHQSAMFGDIGVGLYQEGEWSADASCIGSRLNNVSQ